MNLPSHLLGMSRRETLLSVESGEEISTTLTSNMESNMHPKILVWNRKFLFEQGNFRSPSRFKNAWSYGLENVFGTQVLFVTSWWFCWVWNCFVSTSWLLTFSHVHGSFEVLMWDLIFAIPTFRMIELIENLWGFPKMLVPNNHGFSY